MGRGTWIWAAAPDIEVASSSAKTVFSVRYPTGSTHFMTVFGLKPFNQIKLYEIPYGPDEEFEGYNVSGYLYVRADSTLYLKMKHKKETELVDLSY